MAEDRIIYLEETLKIAEEMDLPVVNVYQASLDAVSQGIPLARWINPKDWIHPGEAGHKFITENIARVLVAEGLI
jgi:lysophospholipase L1-like esterase